MTSWSRGCETPNKMAASGSRFTPSYKLSKLFLTVHLVSRKSRASFRKPEQSVDRGASQAETAIWIEYRQWPNDACRTGRPRPGTNCTYGTPVPALCPLFLIFAHFKIALKNFKYFVNKRWNLGCFGDLKFVLVKKKTVIDST